MDIDDCNLVKRIIEHPSISVIMCVHDTPRNKLEEAVNSVSCQQFEDYEFILIDDHSTNEETIKFIKKFQLNWDADLRKQRLLVHRNQENFGLAYCRNYGIANSQGKWIYFIDSDDYMWGLTLRKMFELVQLWEATTNYQLDMVVGDCLRSGIRVPLGGETGKCPIYYDRYDAFKEICSFSENSSEMYKSHELQFNASWNKLIRKSILYDEEKKEFYVKFKEGYPHEDNFATHKILYKCSGILFLPIQTYLYRFGGAFADGKQFKDIYMVQAKEERQAFLEDWYKLAQDGNVGELEPPIMPYGITRINMWLKDYSVTNKIKYLVNNNYAWIMNNMYRYYCATADKSVFKDILVKPNNGEIDLTGVHCKALFKRINKIMEEEQ